MATQGPRTALTIWVRPDPPGDEVGRVMTPGDVRQLLRSGKLLRLFGRFSGAVIETTDLRTPRAPFLTTTVARLLAPASVVLRGADGQEVGVGLRRHLWEAMRLTRDLAAMPFVQRNEAQSLEALADSPRRPRGPIASTRPAYVRTDLDVGLQAGGSVTHVAGVVNSFAMLGLKPLYVTPEATPGIDNAVELSVLPRRRRYLDFPATSVSYYNLTHARELGHLLTRTPVGWTYHRYSLGSFSAALVARRLGLPFVLEYNGSEVWARAHWGSGSQASTTEERVEITVLRSADVIVVVSAPLRTELVDRGIDPWRILVNPNGVDTDRYRPTIDGAALRNRLGLTGKTVIGFIGTFGRWHGAGVLAEAYRELWRSSPESARGSHLLLIGDGPMMPEVRRRVAGLPDVTFTGQVPQDQGPSYLAACDILVAPHVPNPDGSPFFGSPTKIFEYMAMGRGIVASRLGQIGEVLEDRSTALLVEPGSVTELTSGIATLLGDPDLRCRLGQAARARALDAHTWLAHTERIVAAVADRCG